LSRVGIADLAGRPFDKLSGGERQRVLMARALAQQGTVLLLDEPAAYLDVAHQLELYRLVRLLASEGQAVLVVCHDILVAPIFVDRALLMACGRIVASGKPVEVLDAAHIRSVFGCNAIITWSGQASVQATFHVANTDGGAAAR
jgi:iron complex transport system ATP-binding protein